MTLAILPLAVVIVVNLTLSLYRRHGFEPLGAIQVGSSSTLVRILRGPR